MKAIAKFKTTQNPQTSKRQRRHVQSPTRRDDCGFHIRSSCKLCPEIYITYIHVYVYCILYMYYNILYVHTHCLTASLVAYVHSHWQKCP